MITFEDNYGAMIINYDLDKNQKWSFIKN
jgi:hypothetical protein